MAIRVQIVKVLFLKENHKNGKREKVWTQDLSNFDSSLYKSEDSK